MLVEQALLYLSAAPELIPDIIWDSCCSIFSFRFCHFLFIVLCVLQFTVSDYPFDIFNLFLYYLKQYVS